MSGRKALGRGLDALIPQGGRGATGPAADDADTGDRVRLVEIDRIVPNPRQPRTVMVDETLEELASSIRERGVLEPLLVRPSADGTFELVAGERRLRASKLAGKTEIPVLFREMDDRSSLEVALIENIQREDLNAVDEARAYQRLVEEFGRTHAEISKAVGKNRSTVTNLLRLLHLPQVVLEDVSRGTLSAGHARALLKLENTDKQVELATKMIREGWSVRQAEQVVAELTESSVEEKPTGERTPKPRDPQVARVEDAIRNRVGTEVRVLHTPKGGRIEIRYFSDEELERILEELQIEVH